MLRILSLVGVLAIALLGYKLGMDGGQITVLIIVLGALIVLLGYLQRKHGAKKILGGAVNGLLTMYDPTLPSLSDQDGFYRGMPGGEPGFAPPYETTQHRGEPASQPPQRAYMAQQGHRGDTHVQEVAAPFPKGTLPPVMAGRTLLPPPAPTQATYTPLQQINQYELHLGPNAFIDVQQAFINALILDPTGNVVRVLAEELATKGVPLLFVDVVGAYSSLLSEFPLGWRVCSPVSLQKEGTIDSRAIPLDQDSKDEAKHVGHTILQEGWQVLFQFSSYASPIDAIVTLWDIVQGMSEWEEEQQRRSGRLMPSVIFITEGYRFCPDNNKHSIFREMPNVAEAVRGNIVRELAEGQKGLNWYLATRKITGMEPGALRRCALWMVHQPSIPEVQSGWVTAYIGIQPQELQRIPQTQTMVMDLATRAPQLIAFRESHSQGSSQNATAFTLHTIPTQLPSTSPLSEENTYPFQTR